MKRLLVTHCHQRGQDQITKVFYRYPHQGHISKVNENAHSLSSLLERRVTLNRVKLRNPAAKRGRISTSPKRRSHEEAYHYIIETSYRNHNDDAKKKRKHKILKIPTKEDYQNDELENKCSVKAGTKKKQQLDIPGCGGWVKLACPGGVAIVLTVSLIEMGWLSA